MVATIDKDALVEELLFKPVGPARPHVPSDEDFTREIEVGQNVVTATIRDDEGTVTEGTAYDFLIEEGLDPSEWEVAGFRKSKWADKESVRFTFKRAKSGAGEGTPPLDEILANLHGYMPPQSVTRGTVGAVLGIGDMQFGKTDGDGVGGTLRRTLDVIYHAAERIETLREIEDIGPIHVAWLGDHIEGFVSQNGANAWRTDLTLTEQIRLTRRVMTEALLTFAPMTSQLTMVAVPGNHGEAIRFNGKGVTRYDDSHDTESLIALHDAATKFAPEKFGHVRFFVPETDELTVVTEVAGTVIAHAHGHQWRPGQHFQWWRGQAFNKASAMHEADLLMAGHLHHEETDSDGWRQYIGVPALESESTWFRHSKGTGGAPGAVLALTRDGRTDHKEVIR